MLTHPLLTGDGGQAPSTLAELIQRRADSARVVTLIEARGRERRVSVAQLIIAAKARLANWQARGAKPGQAVIILCEDRLAFLEAFWAATLGGLVPVPVSGGISDEHRAKVLAIATRLDTPWVFTDDNSLDRLAQYAASSDAAHRVAFDALQARRLSTDSVTHDGTEARLHTPKHEDIALIQFSSGSTSAPKGVVLTHRNLLVNLDAIMHAMQIGPRDHMMSWMPLTHDMGLIGFHLVPIASNIDHIIMGTDVFVRRPSLWLEQASALQATVLCSPNFGYEHYLKSFKAASTETLDLTAVRLVFNGAEPISTELIERFNQALAPAGLSATAMFPVYGLAEASLAVSFPPIGRDVHLRRLSREALGVGQRIQSIAASETGASFVSVGVPVPYVEVRIADGDRQALADEHIGHVLIRGENVTTGYLKSLGDTERDRDAIDAEGWLDTGDLGFLSRGELHITGRAKDIVFVNGQNLYPHDLENTLVQAGFVDAGKLAIAARPGPSGDEICVFLLHRGSSEDFVQLRDDVRRELATQAGVRVEQVVPVPRIPKTTSGKVQRFRLLEALLAGDFDSALEALPADAAPAPLEEPDDTDREGPTTPADTSLEQRLLTLCNARIKERDISVSDNLFELGISSLTLAEIHADIEDAWPGKLDITDLFDYPTVAEISGLLQERDAGAASGGLREPVGV